MLVRNADRGLEVFMVRRHHHSRAVPGAYVFPGGTINPADAAVAARWLDATEVAIGSRSDEPVDALTEATLRTCALRELFEEAGVLLARDASGLLADVPEDDEQLQVRLRTARDALQREAVPLDTVLMEVGWVPAHDALTPFSHWVTPEQVPSRFDTWFFVAQMPPGQQALHCDVETTDGRWLTPAEALTGAESGRYSVIFPTLKHLQRLAQFRRVDELLAFAQVKRIRRVQPVWQDPGGVLEPLIAEKARDDW